MNRTRLLILISLGLPFLLGICWWLFYHYFDAESDAGSLSIETRDCYISAVDGARLACRWTQPAEPSSIQVYALLVSSMYRDGDWNTRGLSPRSGARLARQLARLGVSSLRFDHRGMGGTQASQKSLHDLELVQSDIKTALEFVQKRAVNNTKADSQKKDFYLIAHADGCAPAMQAMLANSNSNNLVATGAILISCGTPGSYLDEWGALLFRNMQRHGVESGILQQARSEWQIYKNNGSIPEEVAGSKNRAAPDLIAFRNSLRYIDSPEQSRFREPARRMHLHNSMKTYLNQGGAVLHLLSQYDDEWSSRDRDGIIRFSKQMQLLSGYHFQIVKNCDHVLRVQSAPADHLFAALSHNLSPFRPLSATAVQIMQKFMHIQNL